MPLLGDEFRAAREARHLSLADVSEQIHIRTVYLQSIEEEDWSSGAAPVYIRGFIRTYARFLRLDADRAVAAFNDAIGETAETQRPQVLPPASRRPGGFSPLLWIAGLAALLLVAFVTYEYLQLPPATPGVAPLAGTTGAGLASPLPSGASALPSGAAPLTGGVPALANCTPSGGTGALVPEDCASAAVPAETSTPVPSKTLALRVAKRSWLSVAVDGKPVFEGTLENGARKEFHGSSAHVIVGNAGGVDVLVNGVDKGRMGTSGQVVERTFSLAGV